MNVSYQSVRARMTASPRRWLVTGVAGFIGSALLEELLSLGQDVVGLDSFVTGRRSNLEDAVAAAGRGAAERFRLIEGDIRDPATCREACRGIDLVLHQAALGSVPRSLNDPLASHQSNVDGFLHVALAARDAGVERLVYASSSSVYGDHGDLPKVEDRIGRPLSPYAATKRIDEIYAGVLQRVFGLDLIGLRYFNVFGRRQDPNGPYAAVIPRWIDNLFADEHCLIYGDGSNSRDFCYVDNAVQANLLAMLVDRTTTGEVYNVGCGETTDLRELFELLRDCVSEHYPAAAGVAPEHRAPRPGDVLHSQADISKIRTHLGYEPSHFLREGLAATVRWFAARGRQVTPAT